MEAAGVALHHVTLHVGAGTFLPVKVDDTADHEMHYEQAMLSAGNRRRAQSRFARAAGASSRSAPRRCDVWRARRTSDGALKPYSARTNIFITPGYRFRAVDALLTNFHLPRSTLFMLVCAFSGHERMKAAYAHAIESGYRFYSYGDACLLFPA